jgi:hypothetical protein
VRRTTLIYKSEATFGNEPGANVPLLLRAAGFKSTQPEGRAITYTPPTDVSVARFIIDAQPSVAQKVPRPREGSITLTQQIRGRTLNVPGAVCYTRRRLKSGLVRLFFKRV